MAYNTFSDFDLAAPIMRAVAALGFAEPTLIQSLAIPPQLAGADLIGIACTGSGKTAAYGLPLLHAIAGLAGRAPPRGCRALVLAPTRELAQQIATCLRDLGGGERPRIRLAIGGTPRGGQIAALARGAEVVVATPGRLGDLIRARAIDLSATRHLVVDEADRMLDLGFLEPVRRIAARLATDRQTVMFSATMPAAVAALAGELMRDPVRVEARHPASAERRVAARAVLVAVPDKPRRLIGIVSDAAVARAIVFCRTRRGADRLGRALDIAGIGVGVMHGECSQASRSRTLARFRTGRIAVLVATDLVARGIDVPGVSHVVNYDLPDDAEGYIHRIGRTGRAGACGEAVTLCAPHEVGRLRQLERAIRQSLLPPLCRSCRVALTARRPLPLPRPDCAAAGGSGC